MTSTQRIRGSLARYAAEEQAPVPEPATVRLSWETAYGPRILACTPARARQLCRTLVRQDWCLAIEVAYRLDGPHSPSLPAWCWRQGMGWTPLTPQEAR